MKILVHYPFTPEQIDAFRALAARLGGHDVLFAEDEAAAIAVAGDVEVLMGRFPPAVCAGGAQFALDSIL